MTTEILYPDGSISVYTKSGAMHTGEAALHQIRLRSAEMALRVYIDTDGRMQLTANGAQNAIKYVIAPETGKKYKRSMRGKLEAHDDCITLLERLRAECVVVRDAN